MRPTKIVSTTLAAALTLLTMTATAEKDRAGFVRITPEDIVWQTRL